MTPFWWWYGPAGATNGTINLSGVASAVGTGSLSLSGSSAQALSGVFATEAIGSLQASADGNVIVQIAGAGAAGGLGALAFTGSGLTTPPGASATGFAGLIRLAEFFTPSGRLLLVKKESRFLIIQADGTRFTTIQ